MPKIFAGEPFPALFPKISGSEKIMDKTGENQDFPWKSFCFTVPKNFVGQLFSVAVISGTGKV